MFQNDTGDDHFRLNFGKNRLTVQQFTTKINN
jgi:hypothetical protein